MELNDKTVLITGAARRVGRHIALATARAGANIILHYHSSHSDALAVSAEIVAMGRECHIVQANLADPDSVIDMIKEIDALPGQVDALINSASVFYRTPLAELNVDQWDENLNVNLRAPFLLARHFGLKMKQRGSGHIINLVDCAVRRPYRNYAPYLVSKAGLEMMTRVLALELAPEVRVNSVAPGTVLMPEESTDKLRELIVGKTPLNRIGSPDDVAQMILFLLQHDNFMTGGYYAVDGGSGIPG